MPITVNVTNTTGTPAYLNAWIDFNENGITTDPGEKIIDNHLVATGTSNQGRNFTFNIPAGTAIGVKGVRVRLTTTFNPSESGAAGIGEVEDYALTVVAARDFGDSSNLGVAGSAVVPSLLIGPTVDGEIYAATNVTATGDDNNGTDDEDGVTLPYVVVQGQTSAMTVNVTNLSGATAFLNVWVDWNNNGVLTDVGEQIATNLTISNGTNNTNRVINFTVPILALTGNVPVRVRLTSVSSPGPTGVVGNGEVEDQLLSVSNWPISRLCGANLDIYSVFLTGVGGYINMSGNGTAILGDLAVASGGIFATSGGTVTGTTYYDPPLSGSGPAGMVVRDLSSAKTYVMSVSEAVGNLTPTQVLGDITSSTTIRLTAGNGRNVIRVNSIDLQGTNVLTIDGTTVDFAVLNIVGKCKLTGQSRMTFINGMLGTRLIVNMLPGSTEMTLAGGAEAFNGTFLATQSTNDVTVAGGALVVGTVIANDIKINGGGQIRNRQVLSCENFYDYGDYSGFAPAWSSIFKTLYLGAWADPESDSVPNATADWDDLDGVDDEDGVVVPDEMTQGTAQSMVINATNLSGNPAYLNAWVDFNGNGVLTDAGEQILVNSVVATGSNNLARTINFSVPAQAKLGMTGVRVRLTSGVNPGSIGYGADGEVEDYVTRIVATTDFGDLARLPIAGALMDRNLKIGAEVDTEIVPMINADGTGDDNDYRDDEDGVTVPASVLVGAADRLIVNVTNTSGAAAYVNAWIDFNNNGSLTDAGEQISTNLLVANDTSNANLTLNFTFPVNATIGSAGVRVRLSSASSPGSNTVTGIGEVEDYLMNLVPIADFGDFAGFASASQRGDGLVKIGATVDTELTDKSNAAGTGDDLDGSDDEDGVTLPASLMLGQSGTMTVNVSNSSGATAFLNVWIDFNVNGVLTDAGEQVATNVTVANGTSNSNRTVNFTVPANAQVAVAGVRTRISSVSSPGATGAQSGSGEVEDHTLRILATTDFGDFSGFASASSTASTVLRLGALVDTELDGNSNAQADADNTTDLNDEDGVTLPATMVRSSSGSMVVNVTNTSGATGYLNAWIDWNNNGVLTDAGEQIVANSTVSNGTSNSNRSFSFTAPAAAAFGNLGVRVRFTSTSSPGPTGASGTGEVEDHLLRVVTTTDFGDFSRFASASSTVISTLRIGATTDTEVSANTDATATGDDDDFTDDEDGVTLPDEAAQGLASSMTVRVTNTSGSTAFLNAWIDFNNNGVLTDPGEQVAANTTIATGTANSSRIINFTVPAAATLGAVGVRVRLTSTSSPGSTGQVGNGEVEDNTVLIVPQRDFGDHSLFADASSILSTNVRIGALVDPELVATRNLNASGDDDTGSDDEDGVVFPSMTAGQSTTVPVTVTNTSGAVAYLNAWIDFNRNGLLTDAGEQIATNIAIPNGSSNLTQNITVSVPANAVVAPLSLGTRFRLTSTTSPGATGASGTGEVEDHPLTLISPLTDFGDWSGAPTASNTATSALRLGELVDSEFSGTLNADATGDDITGIDDEDGVVLPAMMAGAPALANVTVNNSTGSNAYLNAWIDYNNNGSFNDAGERFITNLNVVNGASNLVLAPSYTVAATAVTGVPLGVRFRLTSAASPASTGSGGIGEVEDYVAVIVPPTTDFGDFSRFGSASSTAAASLRLGALVDTEFVGTVNTAATGDNLTGLNDEDGVTVPSMWVGAPSSIPVQVTNTSGAVAYLNAWIDWNNNGVLTDAGEQIATNVSVANGTSNATQTINLQVPGTAQTGVSLGLRFRLSSTAAPGSTGFSGTGEVEDYVVTISAANQDFGDFGGFAEASQGINAALIIGDSVDAENASIRDATATGDNLTDLNDETGVTLPAMTAGQTVTIPVVVTNTSGATAYLNAWIDYNNNGVLTDAGEQIVTNSVVANGTNLTSRNFSVAVSAKAVTGMPLGARFRLSSLVSPGSTGSAGGTGEVEDYVITIAAPTTDFGDFSRFGSASSIAVSTLRIGAITDTEYVATSNTAATGDNITGLNDEDGVFLSAMTAGAPVSVPVQVTNTSANLAYLNAWIDYNNNGVLTDAGEQIATNISISPGSVNDFQNLSFTVPATAVTGVNLGARFRLTSTLSPGATGASGNGEVEDYVTSIAAPTTDYGDFSRFADAANGISDKLWLGALVDAEYSARVDATATGDDLDNTDDEDGVTLPAMTAGETVTIPVVVTNTSGAAAFLHAWIDYNNNGVLTDAGEQIAANLTVPTGLTGSTLNLITTVPVGALTGTDLGVRFRLTSSSNPGSTGSLGGSGEVEDYLVNIAAPVTDFGDFSSFGNASSVKVSTLRMGALTDTEYAPTNNAAATGDDLTGVDDEDGVTLPSMIAGAPVTIPVQVTNTSGAPAFLNAWIDFNRNGNLNDAGEQIAVNVSIATGVVDTIQDLNFTVPTTAVTGVNLGVRFRLTSTATPGATGASGNGEVEDYVTVIDAPPTDFGDWSRAGDASSLVNANLRLGDLVDTEFAATRNSAATGDDITGIDDEDGVILPTFTAGAPGTVLVQVTNTTGAAAFLNAWMDFNNNGALADAGEQIATNLSIPADTSNETFTLNLTVPASAVTGVSTGLRFRLTSTASPGSTGAAGTGEVEDYTTTIAEPVTDYGDWNGAPDASSVVSSDLRMGALADAEYSSTRNSAATGDDITGSADEDGVTLPQMSPSLTVIVPVVVTNNTGVSAYLNAWIDFNGNGSWDDAGEQIVSDQVIVTNTTAVTQNLTVNVPSDAAFGQQGARFRLTSVASPSPLGAAGIGEVEDHLASIVSITDYGDWNGAGAQTTTTRSAMNPNIRLGASVDSEPGVTPNAAANTDDTTGSADEDGVTMPASITKTASVTLPVSVFNNSGANAYLNAWIDFNNDGTFNDTLLSNGGERLEAARTLASGATATTQNITFTVPANASVGTQRGVRFRLTDQSTTPPTGAVGSGEIEDYVVTIACPTITVNPSSVADATAGMAYTQTLTASGGSAPYTFAVTSGSLPGWATLNATTGVISGTPNSSTTANFTVTATDANACAGSRAYTLVVNCLAIKLSPVTLTTATVGTPWSQALNAGPEAALVGNYYSGTNFNSLVLTREEGSINYNWGSGAPHASLPVNLFSVRWDGYLQPTTTGSHTFQTTSDDGVRLWVNNVLIIDQWNDHAATNHSATVSLTAGVTVPVRVEYYENSGSAVAQLQWSGPSMAMHPITEWTNATNGIYVWSVAAGALPGGITLNTSSGVLSGTPLAITTATFTIRATDSYGCQGTAAYVLTPEPGLDFGDYSLFGVASSKVYSSLKMGATTDIEIAATTNVAASGDDITDTDDEDGVTVPDSVALGAAHSLTVNVTNTSGATAYLNVWIDFNGNGVLTDAGEQIATNAMVASGTSNSNRTLNFTVPSGATVGNVGVRARLTSTANPGSTGASGNGEVEDNVLTIVASSDFGDHAALGSASSTLASGLRLGVLVDGEVSATTNATATGDDITDLDDEDGVTVPATMMQGTAQTITVNVTNTTGLTAFLNAWIDYNNNGVLTDAGEQIATNTTIATGTSNQDLAINFTVPIGTPPGTLPVRVRLTSNSTTTSTGASGSGEVEDYVTTITCAPITLSPTTLPSAVEGSAYSQTITATGGVAPRSFAVSSGALPAGLTLSTAGVLSGTPTTANGAGTSITLRVTDANGCQGTRAYTLIVCPVVSLSPTTLSTPTVGAAYSAAVTPSGGASPSTFSLASGSLPAGLTLNSSTGEISGTATSATSASFTVRATDANGCTGTRAYTVTPVCSVIAVDQPTLPIGTAGTEYSQLMTASGGTAPYSFALSAGSLPSSLSLSSAGFLSGTPTTSNGAGTSITVRATDTYGCQGTRTLTLQICPVISLSPTTLSNPLVGTAYSATVTPSGGASPYSFSVTSGSLPAGLTLNSSTGVISGTATSSAAATFTVNAADANGCTGTRAYTVTPSCPTITVTPATVAVGVVGTAYSQTMSAAGGSAPFTYAISSGTLPAGLSLNSSSGEISGTPTTGNGAGSSITVRSTDTSGCQGTRSLTLQICPVITLAPTTLATPTVGTAYSATITPSGGASPYVFSLASGALPAGLTLNASTGVISGTATSTTATSFTVRAVDANSCAGTQAYTLTPVCPTITLAPTTLANGTVGTAVNQTLTATGGTAPRTFAVTAGTLPAGVTLSTAGVLSGTPTAAGTSSFTVGVTDTYGCTGTQALSWVIDCPVIAITPASLTNAVQYDAYTITLSATNGTSPYTWSVSAGALPTGLILSSAGVLSGTATAAPGTYNFTARALDAYNCAATKAYALVVTCNVIAIAPTTLPKAYYNTAYSQTLTATQGTAPYTWTVIAGAPPSGITLSTAGVLSGSSLVYGDANFTVRATDVNGCTNTRAMTLTVKGLSIGNLVYDDANFNGMRDPGEPGVPNVTVQLWSPGTDNLLGGSGADADVQLGASITTDANGGYLFADLPPGWYFVRVIPTVELPYRGGLPVNLDNGIDNDNNAALQPGGRGTVITGPVIELSEGAEPVVEDADADTDLTLDFGLFAGLRLGNLVWADINDNGLHDLGETGLNGVRVEIWNTGADSQIGGGEDILLATTTTSGGGLYTFADLPPEFLYVRIPAPPAGHPLASSVTSQSGADDDNDGYQVSAGAAYSGVIDMAAVAFAGNYTNNTVDFGFIPVAAPSVYLSASQADGVQVFNGSTGLFNGTLNHPFGTSLSQGTADGDDVPHDMELGPDGNWYVAHPAVGNLRKIAANGTDLGVALDNVTAGISAIRHFAIGPDRNFYVVDATGDRVVRFHGPFSSTPGAPLGTAPYTFISQAGISDLNFGPDGNLYVLVQDGASREIRRHDATTGALMNVVVTAVQVAGTAGGGDANPQVSGFDIYDSVLYGVNNTDGEVFSIDLTDPAAPGLPQLLATIASAGKGTVEMRDAEFNPAENRLYIAGYHWGKPVGAAAYASGALVRVDIAAAPNGAVSVFEAPIPAPPGPNDETWSGPLDVCIGRPFAPLLETVAIGSLVWHDANADGQQDGGEPGIGGVRVELWRDANNNVADGAETLIGWTFTDANGHYYFSGQAAGLYQVKIPATNFGAGMPLEGTAYSSPLSSNSDDQVDGDDSGRQPAGPSTLARSPLISLQPGTEPVGDGLNGAEHARGGELDNYTVDANGDMTVDFGFVEEGEMGIGNLVFVDANANNVFDEGEGLDDAVLELYRWGATPGVSDPVATTVTAGGGLFLFSNLWEGQYFLHLPAAQFESTGELRGLFSIPGFSIGDDDTGEDSLDSDEPWVTGVSSGLVNLMRDQAPDDGGDETGYDSSSDLNDLNINLTIDFGLFRAVALGNLVFADNNSNGAYDIGEGLAGVGLELYSDAQFPGVDPPLAVTTSGIDGKYGFKVLREGNYVVHIPAAQFQSGGPLYQRISILEGVVGDDDVGEDGINNGDPTVNGVSTTVVSLFLGGSPTDENGETGFDHAADNQIDASSDLTIDFGFQSPVGVGNLVYIDHNVNGRADDGEGVDGVVVELYRSNQLPGFSLPIFTRTTAGGGKYFFDYLPSGGYILHIPADEFEQGRPLHGLLSAPGASAVTLTLDDDVAGNENGIDDPTPFVNGISSAVFNLAVDVEPTDANGESGAFNDIDAFDDNNFNLTIDFAFVEVDSSAVGVGNMVFLDLNANGVHDEGEGVDGVKVQLFAAADNPATAAPLFTTYTADGGSYLFSNLVAGDYQILIPPSEFASGKPLFGWRSSAGAGGDDGIDDNQDENGLDATDPTVTGVVSVAFNLTPGEEPTNALGEFGANAFMDDLNDANTDLTIDFGFFHPVAVGNLVFIDANANGHADAGEGVAGVMVELYAEGSVVPFDAPIDQTMSASDGSYLFGKLMPGNYFIHVPSSQFGFGMPLHSHASVTGVQTGDDNLGEDGIDDGSPTLNGISTAVFTLGVTSCPVGSAESGYLGSSDDAEDAATDLTIDLGFVPAVQIGNLVFNDANNDGSFDPNTEYGIDGVTVELRLIANNSTVATTTTTAGGTYLFTIAPGTYYVQLPAANFDVGAPLQDHVPAQSAESGGSGTLPTSTAGDDDVAQDGYTLVSVVTVGARTPAFTVARGAAPTEATGETGHLSYEDDADDANADLTVDLGFVIPAGQPANIQIGNLIFDDANNDGSFDPGTESGIDGVEVELRLSSNDLTIASTITADSGAYLFAVPAGNYYVHVPAMNFDVGGALQSYVPSQSLESGGSGTTPSSTAGDDDVGQDGYSTGTVVSVGARTPGFTVLHGGAPTAATGETGHLAALDDAEDAETDLTVDLGFVYTAGQPSGSSMRRALSGDSAPAASTFAAWQTQHSMAGSNGPNDDPDADGLTNLMEYALGSAADHGFGAARFVLAANAVTGAIDAVVTRPAGDRPDLRFVLEGSHDLAAWGTLTITPAVTTGANQTQTLRYADITNAPFLRLKVLLDADLDGRPEATAVSAAAQGWAQRELPVGRQTLSMPLLRAAIFTGKVASRSGNTITLNTGGNDLSTLMPSGSSHYVEVLDGSLVGRIFDIASASGSSISLTATADPALVGARLRIRPHWTLGALVPVSAMTAADTPEAADRVMFYDSATGDFRVFWLRTTGSAAQWVRAEDTTLADAGSHIMPPQEGMLVQVRTAAANLILVGETRTMALALPPSAGTHFIGTGLVLPQAPGAQSHRSGSRIRLWTGDADPEASGYQQFLLSPQSRWLEEATGADVTTQPILEAFRGFFLVK